MTNGTPQPNCFNTWTFIVDKIISWPVLIGVCIMVFYGPIKDKIKESNEIKIGDFQMTVNKIAESFGISNVTKDINSLSYDELKLFLIVGGEDADSYIFTPTNIPHGKLVQMYEDLAKNDLIQLIDPNTIPGYTKANVKAAFAFKTTKKGVKVHRALLDAIFSSLIESKVTKPS